MLGEFYGLTGAIAPLLELSSVTVSRLASVMNNSLDAKGLSKFKREIDYLASFLDEKVKLAYNNPQIRRLSRQVGLIKEGDITSLQRTFKIDIEGMTDDQKLALVNRIESEIEDIAKQNGLSPEVVNYFHHYSSKEALTLGSDELKVLYTFKKYYRREFTRYSNMIKVGSFREEVVFGEKLHLIASYGPSFLIALVERMLIDPSMDNEKLRRICLEGVRVLRNHYPSEEDIEFRLGSANQQIPNFSFKEYLLSERGMNPATVELVDIPADVSELIALAEEESSEYRSLLAKLVTNNSISTAVAGELNSLYYKLFRLDYDASYISELLQLDRTIELKEIDSLYNSLNNIGFYYFHRSNVQLFVEQLKKLSFSSESKVTIDPDKDKNGMTFARALRDIELFADSLSPVGTGIEEVLDHEAALGYI